MLLHMVENLLNVDCWKVFYIKNFLISWCRFAVAQKDLEFLQNQANQRLIVLLCCSCRVYYTFWCLLVWLPFTTICSSSPLQWCKGHLLMPFDVFARKLTAVGCSVTDLMSLVSNWPRLIWCRHAENNKTLLGLAKIYEICDGPHDSKFTWPLTLEDQDWRRDF